MHSVHGRLEAVVGQAHEEVANVDDEGTGDRGGLDPLSVVHQDLEPPDHVLPENGKALEIRVRAQTDVLWGAGGELGLTFPGIVI